MFKSLSNFVSKFTNIPVPSSTQADSCLSVSGPPIAAGIRDTYAQIESHENDLRALAQACAVRLRSIHVDERDTLTKVKMYIEAKEGPQPKQGISVDRLDYFVRIKEPHIQTQLLLLNRILDSFSDTLTTLGSLSEEIDPGTSRNLSPRLALSSGGALVAMLQEARGLRDRIQEGLESDARSDGEGATTTPFEKLIERYRIFLREPATHSRICPSEELIEKFSSWTP